MAQEAAITMSGIVPRALSVAFLRPDQTISQILLRICSCKRWKHACDVIRTTSFGNTASQGSCFASTPSTKFNCIQIGNSSGTVEYERFGGI